MEITIEALQQRLGVLVLENWSLQEEVSRLKQQIVNHAYTHVDPSSSVPSPGDDGSPE